MSKELEKEFMNDVMDKIELKVEPTDIAKLLYDIYDVPSGICEQVKDMVQRLDKYEQILGSGRLTDRNYKNTTLDLDSCKPYVRLGQLEDIYEGGKQNG